MGSRLSILAACACTALTVLIGCESQETPPPATEAPPLTAGAPQPGTGQPGTPGSSVNQGGMTGTTAGAGTGGGATPGPATPGPATPGPANMPMGGAGGAGGAAAPVPSPMGTGGSAAPTPGPGMEGTAGTGSEGPSGSEPVPNPGSSLPATFGTLQSVITEAPCFGAGCHNDEQNRLDLMIDDDLHARITSQISENCGNIPIINAGNPEESALVKILKGPCGPTPRMPIGCVEDGDTLCIPPDYIAALEAWIAAGAPAQ